MDVKSFSPNGKSIINQKGELVCISSFPSMPIYFWNDSKNIKYKKAYFEKYDEVWNHGDFIKIIKHRGLKIYGRSDATLNPGGIRIGTFTCSTIIVRGCITCKGNICTKIYIVVSFNILR